MPYPFARSTLASAILFAPFPALAQDSLVLDETVVSAAGHEQKVTEAPASISVIGATELQEKRYNNLAQALGDVEGIDIGQGTGKTGGLNISIRGMPSEYTLILIDGRRQKAAGNVTPNGFGETSTSFMPPLSAIERIEVIRGPMSTLYGSDAMGGVINIITKKVAREWHSTLTLDHTFQEHSDFGATSNISLYTSGPLVDDLLGLTLRGSFFDREASDLQFDNDTEVSKRGLSPVDGTHANLGARLTLTPHPDHDFSLDMEKGRQKYNNDDNQLGTLDEVPTPLDPDGGRISGYSDELRFEREQIALIHTGRFAIGTLDSSLMHNNTETIGRTIPGSNAGNDFGTPVPAIPSRIVGNDRELKTTNLIFDTRLVSPIGDAHTLTVGAQWWDAKMTDGLATQEYEQTTWSLFMEDEWYLLDNLALTLGARYDDHDAFGGHVSPRAYLVWNSTAHWTLKGGISRGYKTPDLNDLHDGVNGVTGQGSRLTIGSPDLEPETSTSTEFGVYYDNLAGFSANATLFHNQFEDKIATGDDITISGNPSIPDGTYSQQINVDEAVTQGLELAGRWQFAPEWSLSGNYTYTDSEQKSGENKGQPLTLTPEHLANMSLNWQASDRLRLWLKGEYRGERARFNSTYANLANANGSYSTTQSIYDTLGAETKAFTLVHLGGSYRATENLTLNASIYNLLDKDFLNAQAYPAFSNTGAPNGQGYGTDYSHSTNAATGTIQEGRRLWLSAVIDF